MSEDRRFWVAVASADHARRGDVTYAKAGEASILPLLNRLELTRGKQNWGYSFRFGLVEISERDFDMIAAAMGVTRGTD